MARFLLIHGGHARGAIWNRLVSELNRRGHYAAAPDMPCDQANARYADYRAAALTALGEWSGPDVAVVGHSLGGYTALLVAAAREVGHVVCVGSVPALGGRPIPRGAQSILQDVHETAVRYTDGAGLNVMQPRVYRQLFFNDCTDVDAGMALLGLRPQNSGVLTEPYPLATWPAAARHVILMHDDQVVNYERGVVAAREMLGGREPLALPGGHTPQWSRPQALADLLEAIAGHGAARAC